MEHVMSKHCLIIDNGAELDMVASDYLNRSDFTVSQAQTCDEALEICRTAMPDLILLKSDTPKMSGLEFLTRLRRSERGREPVVLYCGRGEDPAGMGHAIWRGASECLITPFDEDLLDFKLNQSGM